MAEPTSKFNDLSSETVTKLISILVAIVVFAVVLVPICSGLASGNGGSGVPGGENVDPVSDLRLTYTEDKIPMMLITAFVDGANGLTVEVYDSMEDYMGENPSYSIAGITDDVIIFASDYVSMFYLDGDVATSYVDETYADQFAGIVVMGEGVGINSDNLVPYTFLYYPSENGEYANFSAYEFDSGNMFAIGSNYGMTLASKDGKFVGYSPYDVTTSLIKEDGEVIGVEYSATMGDGTGTLPDMDDDDPQTPIMG